MTGTWSRVLSPWKVLHLILNFFPTEAHPLPQCSRHCTQILLQCFRYLQLLQVTSDRVRHSPCPSPAFLSFFPRRQKRLTLLFLSFKSSVCHEHSQERLTSLAGRSVSVLIAVVNHLHCYSPEFQLETSICGPCWCSSFVTLGMTITSVCSSYEIFHSVSISSALACLLKNLNHLFLYPVLKPKSLIFFCNNAWPQCKLENSKCWLEK